MAKKDSKIAAAEVPESMPVDSPESGAPVETPPVVAEPRASEDVPLYSDDPNHPGYDPPTYEADPNTSLEVQPGEEAPISPAQPIEVYASYPGLT